MAVPPSFWGFNLQQLKRHSQMKRIILLYLNFGKNQIFKVLQTLIATLQGTHNVFFKLLPMSDYYCVCV